LIMRLKKEEFEPNFIGDYVIRMIDMTIEELKGVPSMIDRSFFYSAQDNTDGDLFSSEKLLILKTIKDIRELILKHDTVTQQKKLTEAVNMVEKEVRSGLFNSLIMDAMLSFLEKEKSLKIQVAILNNLKSKLGDDVLEGNK